MYVTDAVPNYCPGCGKDLLKVWANLAVRQSYLAQVSQQCSCGVTVQFASQASVIAATKPQAGAQYGILNSYIKLEGANDYTMASSG